jgi:hypothetical protein
MDTACGVSPLPHPSPRLYTGYDTPYADRCGLHIGSWHALVLRAYVCRESILPQTGSILIIDQERTIADLLVEFLTDAGYVMKG